MAQMFRVCFSPGPASVTIAGMFEIKVEDIFTITGRGTIFVGQVLSGSISVGEPVACKTRSKEVQSRVIALEEPGSNRLLQKAESGRTVVIVCKSIDHTDIADAWEDDGAGARVVGVTLVAGQKKSWWKF
jgi:translation elongation factor EF-Tu-like GTPase